MNRTVSIVGAGRAGRAMAKRLRQLGWKIGAVVTRSKWTSRQAVREIGAGKAYATVESAVFEAGLILLATPDAQVEEVARKLAFEGGKKCRGKIALHLSGALDRRVLWPLAQRGAHTGSLHPMQTFSGRGLPRLEGVTFTIEGDPAALRAARRIVRSMDGVPVEIAGKHKPVYHAAGALVAGHGLGLTEAAVRVLMRIGFSRPRAQQALLPLIRQMLDNYEEFGPEAAWTGPISRGDFATVAKHRVALRPYPREVWDAYSALAFLSAEVVSQKPAATKRNLKRTIKSARGGSN
jgi:predicted short-subunit dehydrogenase-like oxidoreductase (DUF2520 family)